MDTEREIGLILSVFPDRFTEEEKRQIHDAISGRSQGYEIRQCDVCGAFMNEGHYFEDGIYYCSEECMHKDGISDKDYLAYYYGFEPSEISEEVMALPYQDFEWWCMKHGNEDLGTGYYTEWDCPTDLIDRLNKCRRELQDRPVRVPGSRDEALDGFYQYWKEEVLPLYERDGLILESLRDALGNESPYRDEHGFMTWEDAIAEVAG